MFLKTFKKSFIFVLLLLVAILMMTGCGGTSNPGGSNPGDSDPGADPAGDGPSSALIGTWNSSGINPSIRVILGECLGSINKPELNVVEYYYKGEVSCSVLKDGKKTISTMPSLSDIDSICIQKSLDSEVLIIMAGLSDDSSGDLSVSGYIESNQLKAVVCIDDPSGNTIYATPEGSYDIFTKN